MKVFFKQKKMRLITIFLVSIVIISQLSLPVKANAASLPVIDPVHIATSIFGWLQNAYQFTQSNFILKSLTQSLKKRVLAMMSDQIIDWINNGKKPTFTTDFGSVFREAGNVAVGDVLQQYVPELCQPFAFDITLQLQQPAQRSQQVRCSLSSVVKSYDDYRKSFKNGGWLAYQELLKPQNNQWGTEIIVQSEILNITAQKTNASILQQQINVGFNSEKCTGGWDLIDTRTNQIATKYPVTHFPPPPDKSRAPNDPPKQLLPPGDPNVILKCTSATVTTPGRTMVEGLNKALYSNFDLTINDPDLSNALASILDAAFNKLIKKGAAGLISFVSGTDTKSQSEHSTNVQNAGRDLKSNEDRVADNIRKSYQTQLGSAADTLASASSTLAGASAANQDIIAAANSLLACSLSPENDTFAKNAINAAKSTQQTILIKSAQWNAISSNVSRVTAGISAGSCDMACLNQNQKSIGDILNAANSLNVDANNILLGVQDTLTDLQVKLKSLCKV